MKRWQRAKSRELYERLAQEDRVGLKLVRSQDRLHWYSRLRRDGLQPIFDTPWVYVRRASLPALLRELAVDDVAHELRRLSEAS